MTRKMHTIVITPSTPGKRVLRISLPSFCWRIFHLLLLGILFWAGLGTWSLYQHRHITQESLLLAKESQLSKNLLEGKKQEIKYLNKQLERIRRQTIFIRNFLGLEPRGKTEGTIGQGGEEVSPQSLSFSSGMFSQAYPAGPNHEELIRTASLTPPEIGQVYSDLRQIVAKLEGKQEEMEHTPSVSPVDPQKSWISSSFGMRISPFTGKKQLHLGIDLAGWKGTPIVAPANGKVFFLGKQGLLGLVIKIRHNKVYSTEYGHLLKAAVKKGQEVKRGEIIGYMGNSGRSTGHHVHYGIKYNGKHVNPFPYMMDWDKNYLLFAEGDESLEN